MKEAEHVMLSDEQIRTFQMEGYLALDTITTPTEIQRLRQSYDLLLALHTGCASTYDGELSQVDQALKREGRILLTNPQRYHPAFLQTLFEGNALRIARQLVGGEVKLHESYILYKPAHFGTVTPWHQEEAYLPPERAYDLLIFWLALQDTREEAGGMSFLPGSQKLDILPHSRWESGDTNTVLAVHPGLFDVARAVFCPLPAGGATIHTSRTLHYAGPNLSDAPRRAFILDIEYPRPL
jgi:ectoine hydroxylase-related dioxygenase (phytanoyl-CoA dioxygenase family)